MFSTSFCLFVFLWGNEMHKIKMSTWCIFQHGKAYTESCKKNCGQSGPQRGFLLHKVCWKSKGKSVISCSKEPHSKVGWKTSRSYRWEKRANCLNQDNRTLFGRSLLMVLFIHTQINLQKLALSFVIIWPPWKQKYMAAYTHIARIHTWQPIFLVIVGAVYYLPSLRMQTFIRICVNHWHSQAESIQSLWRLRGTSFTGERLMNKYMNKQTINGWIYYFPAAAASKRPGLPPFPSMSSPLVISPTLFSPCIRLFHLLFLTLRHASCVTQMGT